MRSPLQIRFYKNHLQLWRNMLYSVNLQLCSSWVRPFYFSDTTTYKNWPLAFVVTLYSCHCNGIQVGGFLCPTVLPCPHPASGYHVYAFFLSAFIIVTSQEVMYKIRVLILLSREFVIEKSCVKEEWSISTEEGGC